MCSARTELTGPADGAITLRFRDGDGYFFIALSAPSIFSTCFVGLRLM
jgi:hypothetical protein